MFDRKKEVQPNVSYSETRIIDFTKSSANLFDTIEATDSTRKTLIQLEQKNNLAASAAYGWYNISVPERVQTLKSTRLRWETYKNNKPIMALLQKDIQNYASHEKCPKHLSDALSGLLKYKRQDSSESTYSNHLAALCQTYIVLFDRDFENKPNDKRLFYTNTQKLLELTRSLPDAGSVGLGLLGVALTLASAAYFIKFGAIAVAAAHFLPFIAVAFSIALLVPLSLVGLMLAPCLIPYGFDSGAAKLTRAVYSSLKLSERNLEAHEFTGIATQGQEGLKRPTAESDLSYDALAAGITRQVNDKNVMPLPQQPVHYAQFLQPSASAPPADLLDASLPSYDAGWEQNSPAGSFGKK